MFSPQKVNQFHFKHIRAGHVTRQSSKSRGKNKPNSLSPTVRQLDNDTFPSQEIYDSNQYLRNRLRNAQSSVTFLTDRVRSLQAAEKENQKKIQELENELRQSKQSSSISTSKYKTLKKLMPQLNEFRMKVKEQEQKQTKMTEENRRLNVLCEKYNSELKKYKDTGPDTDRISGQNAQLNKIIEQMKPELKRLADILEATNQKMERFEFDKKKLTKELFIARMQKQTMTRLFDKLQNTNERQSVIIQEYNEVIIRWAQILEENEQLHLQNVHLNEELNKLGWKRKDSQEDEPSKDRKKLVPPLTFPNSSKNKTHIKQFFQGIANCSIIPEKQHVRIIDSEQSCQLVTPGTAKRVGVIRSASKTHGRE